MSDIFDTKITIGNCCFHGQYSEVVIPTLAELGLDIIALNFRTCGLSNKAKIPGFSDPMLCMLNDIGEMTYIYMKEDCNLLGRSGPWVHIEAKGIKLWVTAAAHKIDTNFTPPPCDDEEDELDLTVEFQVENGDAKIFLKDKEDSLELNYDSTTKKQAIIPWPPTSFTPDVVVLQKHFWKKSK